MIKGDYVVCKIANKEQLFTIESHPVYDIKNRIAFQGKPVIFDTSFYSLPADDIRPAVLADWAVEIPEQCKIIIVDVDKFSGGKGDYMQVLFDRDNIGKFNYGISYERWIADALSAHYSIPIMSYEQYKKYMEVE